MNELFMNVGYSFISAIIVFAFMFFAKVILDMKTKKYYNADYEIEEGDNTAIALRRAGLYLGIALAMFGAIKGGILLQIVDGLLILTFLMISMFISDKIIFPGICNSNELKNGNKAIGFVEAGMLAGTGVIAYGSFEGLGPWYSSLVFFVLGQILLVLMTRLYEFAHPNILERIKEGNTSAGILLGGIIFGYSLILKAAVEGPFVSWTEDFVSFGTSAIFGLLMLLLLANKAVDKIFLPGSQIGKELEEENPAAILVVVSVKIAIAYIISAVVI